MVFFDIVSSIPVVGTGVAFGCYMTGNVEQGNKALYQSIRSTLVMTAGAVGAVGGPGSAALAAVYTGAITDACASAISREPKGIIKGTKDIARDISKGEVPVKSVLNTAVMIGADSLSGIGMGGIASASGKTVAVVNVGKQITGEKFAVKITEGAVKQVVKTSVETTLKSKASNAVVDTITEAHNHIKRSTPSGSKPDSSTGSNSTNPNNQRNPPQNEKQNSNNSPTSSGSGSEPPRNNLNNPNQHYSYNFSYFIKILKSLIKLLGEAQQSVILAIFENLSEKQREYFLKIIITYKNCGLGQIMKIVIEIITKHFPHNLNFPDFLSLVEIVVVHIREELNNRHVLRYCGVALNVPREVHSFQPQQINGIVNDPNFTQNVITNYLKIKDEIESEIKSPNEPLLHDFRNIEAAIYHYFKHSKLEGEAIFTVKDYYKWIRYLLNLVKDLPEYSELCDTKNKRESLTYEVYMDEFKRRFRIILQLKNGKVVLLSVYLLNYRKGDKKGDEYVDGVRRKK